MVLPNEKRVIKHRGFNSKKDIPLLPRYGTIVECHNCSYEPDHFSKPPKYCPKCGSQSWQKYAIPGSTLTNIERAKEFEEKEKEIENFKI